MKCCGCWYLEAVRNLRAAGKSFLRTIHMIFIPGTLHVTNMMDDVRCKMHVHHNMYMYMYHRNMYMYMYMYSH